MAGKESQWSQLLPELLTRISLLVFGRGDVGVVAIIPSVCKSWNNSFDINYTTFLIRKCLHDPPLNPLPPQYPCLLTLRDSLCKFYHPNHTFTMYFHELSGSYIQFSKFGWLLLRRCRINSDFSRDYFFFNPFTREKIELPPYEHGFYSMCFSSPPTSTDCYVIGLGLRADGFGIIKRGEQQWKFYGPNNKTKGARILSHLVLCKDRCYGIEVKNKMLVFDLRKKKLDCVRRPFPELANVDDLTKFLISDGTELLSVIVSHQEEKISIARLNESKQERVWDNISTTNYFRNKMLFVSKTSSFFVQAPPILKASGNNKVAPIIKAAMNKIYFPKILNDTSFVPYCFATRKYISFLGDYSSDTPCDQHIKEWTNCTWIDTMPFDVTPSSNQTIQW